MAIMRWDPFSETLRMQREMDRLFGRLGTAWSSGEFATSGGAWMPSVDVKTMGDEMVIYAELPGLEREDIDVEVTEGLLTIKGERKSTTEKSEEGWLIRERSYGSFERSLALPDGVEADKITADYKGGLLEVHVPKARESLKPKSRRIPLSAGSK